MRAQWIDACKGIGITIVVAGHVFVQTKIEAAFCWFVFLFHMPLFFILSGSVFRCYETKIQARKKFSSLLVPYISFLLLITVLNFIALAPNYVPHDAYIFVYTISKGLIGGRVFSFEYGILWFIKCLFLSSLLFNEILLKFESPFSIKMLTVVCALFILSVAIGYFPFLSRIPWSASNVPLAIVFIWVGYATKDLSSNRLFLFGFIGVAVAVLAGKMGAGFEFNMKCGNYGPPALGSGLAVSLSLVLMAFFKFVETVWFAPLAFLGRASLVIMFLHQFVHYKLVSLGWLPAPLIFAVALVAPLLAYIAFSANQKSRTLFLGRPATRRFDSLPVPNNSILR